MSDSWLPVTDGGTLVLAEDIFAWSDFGATVLLADSWSHFFPMVDPVRCANVTEVLSGLYLAEGD